MSRHLMARFRHLHAAEIPPIEWTHGVALPHTEEWRGDRWREVTEENDGLHNPDQYDTSRNSVALAHHGEQRYGLEVMPFQPWKDSPPGMYTWTIQKQIGPDVTDPDHWGHYFHLLKEHGPNSQNPSGAIYSGGGGSREEAMAEAEKNFRKHVDFLNSRNTIGTQNYDDVFNLSDDLDDNYGDIFGSGR